MRASYPSALQIASSAASAGTPAPRDDLTHGWMTMEPTFDAQPPATANARPTERPTASLLGEVLARWPTAPVAGVGASGRWLTFERPDGGTVYLQRYAWDDRS